MKRLPPLDFRAGAPRPWVGLSALGFAAVVLALGAGLSWRQHQVNEEVTARIAQRQAALSPAVRRPSAADRLRVSQSDRVTSELRAPWSELLATFEAQGRPEVGLLKLEPDARSGIVRVTGHAKDTAALFSYLKALEADARLRDVALVSHELDKDTPGQPLRFVMQAAWRVTRNRAKDLS